MITYIYWTESQALLHMSPGMFHWRICSNNNDFTSTTFLLSLVQDFKIKCSIKSYTRNDNKHILLRVGEITNKPVVRGFYWPADRTKPVFVQGHNQWVKYRYRRGENMGISDFTGISWLWRKYTLSKCR